MVNCNPPDDYGQTCEPQGTRWKDGKLYLTTRHRGILTYDPKTKELAPTTLISMPKAICSSPTHGAPGWVRA